MNYLVNGLLNLNKLNVSYFTKRLSVYDIFWVTALIQSIVYQIVARYIPLELTFIIKIYFFIISSVGFILFLYDLFQLSRHVDNDESLDTARLFSLRIMYAIVHFVILSTYLFRLK